MVNQVAAVGSWAQAAQALLTAIPESEAGLRAAGPGLTGELVLCPHETALLVGQIQSLSFYVGNPGLGGGCVCLHIQLCNREKAKP